MATPDDRTGLVLVLVGMGPRGAGLLERLVSNAAAEGSGPVEVHLVMTDRAMLGSGDGDRSVFEPARISGHGSVPAPVARAWLLEGLTDLPDPSSSNGGTRVDPVTATGAAPQLPTAARVWVRRLYTSPDGRDLVAMDSRRRLFGGLLRRMLVLRDDVCTTPWCEAPIVHADHAIAVREGGVTGFEEGNGKCARCNQTKEAPGWRTRVITREASHGGPGRDRVDGEQGRDRCVAEREKSCER